MLASEAGSYVTGTTILVDGGVLARGAVSQRSGQRFPLSVAARPQQAQGDFAMRQKFFSVLAMVILAACGQEAEVPAAQALFEQVNIFEAETGGYAHYRVPAIAVFSEGKPSWRSSKPARTPPAIGARRTS